MVHRPSRSSVRLLPLLAAAAVSALAGPAQAADPDPWLGPDKALHFAAGAGLAVGGYAVASAFSDDVRVRLLVGAGAGLAGTAAKELVDLAGPGSASWKDFTWGAIGCAVGLAVAWAVDRWIVQSLWPRDPTLVAP